MKKSDELKMQIEQVQRERHELEEKIREKYGKPWWNDIHAHNDFFRSGGKVLCDKEEELDFCYHRELNREIDVGDGVTYCLWSDRYACTVIKKTAKTITIQRDKAILDPNFKPEWVVGGFSAVCLNDEEQDYTYERNPDGEIFVCHWSEKRGRYQCGSDGSIKIVRGRHEYYDRNF